MSDASSEARETARRRAGASAVRIRVGVPLDLTDGKWLLNPGAVGAPSSSRLGWWDALDVQAGDGASWLLLDLGAAHGYVAPRTV